ncbi:flavoprotein [Streptomyces sp. PCS3-D2]|uniref:flavoprotein n=1 Tax=Streptomyces sp. PCS3-D2 TaxID=1460244 RepID=UPI0004458986|nr:flavoprotein [Streptomyces sp. PCS3-D2]WKV70182.1 flavoprotein [Streptomyces sp. PCS3-D2]
MTMKTLYLLCSAAPPVFDVAHVIEDAQARGWNVCLGLSPTAAHWLAESLDGLAALTGHPVLWQYPLPGEPEQWPAADALLYAPATFNTVNAWALGLTDTLTVGLATEALGNGTPVTAVSCTNSALAAHPRYETSLATLRGAGVQLLLHDNTPMQAPAHFPWATALNGLGHTAPQH